MLDKLPNELISRINGHLRVLQGEGIYAAYYFGGSWSRYPISLSWSDANTSCVALMGTCSSIQEALAPHLLRRLSVSAFGAVSGINLEETVQAIRTLRDSPMAEYVREVSFTGSYLKWSAAPSGVLETTVEAVQLPNLELVSMNAMFLESESTMSALRRHPKLKEIWINSLGELHDLTFTTLTSIWVSEKGRRLPTLVIKSCHLEVEELQVALQRLNRLGIRIVSVSPKTYSEDIEARVSNCCKFWKLDLPGLKQIKFIEPLYSKGITDFASFVERHPTLDTLSSQHPLRHDPSYNCAIPLINSFLEAGWEPAGYELERREGPVDNFGFQYTYLSIAPRAGYNHDLKSVLIQCPALTHLVLRGSDYWFSQQSQRHDDLVFSDATANELTEALKSVSMSSLSLISFAMILDIRGESKKEEPKVKTRALVQSFATQLLEHFPSLEDIILILHFPEQSTSTSYTRFRRQIDFRIKHMKSFRLPSETGTVQRAYFELRETMISDQDEEAESVRIIPF